MRIQRGTAGWSVNLFSQPEVQPQPRVMPKMITRKPITTHKKTNWTERKRIACVATEIAIEAIRANRQAKDLEMYLASDEN